MNIVFSFSSFPTQCFPFRKMHTKNVLFLGLVVRIVVLWYGVWHDSALPVRYTDVDYDVFSDAACSVYEGGSPYVRQTYRYPPVLAWVMVPGCLGGMWVVFGKVLFCICDVGCAAVLLWMCLPTYHRHVHLLWLFNPVIINISTRGNADSLVLLPILLALAAHIKSNTDEGSHTARISAGISLAFAVHIRLFPVIFLPSIGMEVLRPAATRQWSKVVTRGLGFGLPFVAVLSGLTYASFALYGEEYLENAYKYHYGRVDHRHNLSPYFLPAYVGGEVWGGFGPQLLALLAVSLRFFREPAYCWFLCTTVFVTLNKVATVQYFAWYLGLLPPALRHFSVPFGIGCGLVTLWVATLAYWLYNAHKLEFRGKPVFEDVWHASLLFLAANTLCVVSAIVYHTKDKTKGD